MELCVLRGEHDDFNNYLLDNLRIAEGIRSTVGNNVWTTAQNSPEPCRTNLENSESTAFLPATTKRMHLTITRVMSNLVAGVVSGVHDMNIGFFCSEDQRG